METTQENIATNQADARKFLELLISACPEMDPEKEWFHSWRQCTRCLALAELDRRQPLAVRFMQTAIDALASGVNTHE